MIDREITSVLQRRLADYPAVLLLGARQVGKTTLAKWLGGVYFDLENPGDQNRLQVEWPRYMAGSNLVVLDEAQTLPSIFPLLRGAIDAQRQRRGRFLLLGSVSPELMTQVSEALTGRLALVELPPFNLTEIGESRWRDLWLYGGYPEGGILSSNRYPHWQLDYLRLLASRDLPNWGLPARPRITDRLLSMLSAVHGQIWNASEIGKSLGLTHPTVNYYMDFLEGAYLVRRLPPFRANLKKRLTKRPKFFWRDTGLLHALLGIGDHDQLLRFPYVGASWESFVIEQTLRCLAAKGGRSIPSFFRTSDGYEIDLVLDVGGERWAIEAKLSANPGPGDLRRLNKAADLIGAHRRILISQTPNPLFGEREFSVSLPSFLEWIRRRVA